MKGIILIVDVGCVLKNSIYLIGEFSNGRYNRLNDDGTFTSKDSNVTRTYTPDQFENRLI